MTEDTLKSLLEHAAERCGVHFVDMLLRGSKGGTVLEVYVDTERGVTADELADVSRSLDAVLDAGDYIAGKYTLIVSSPGLGRPIRFPWQYTRHVGRMLDAVVDVDGEERRVSGIIAENGEHALRVTLGGVAQDIPHDRIREAHIVASL